ncbi:MAG: glycogen debranching enzyme N-terminal domain-containing protein [Fimbriimonadaceae bacterium]|nr:glycogen debranching enzyme N-terminal domain-containing protein [Fimbriimonadaceae bacterium]
MQLGIDNADRLDTALHREWLETDGRGNYASGTISGVNTRRYHGLLVAQTGDPGRRVLLAKLDETVFVRGQRHELAANQYPDTIHPQGYRFVTSFRLDPWPIWTFAVADCVLERQILMLHEQAATLVLWRLVEGVGPVNLELRPMLAGRDYHSLACENWSFRRQAESFGQTLDMQPYDAGSRTVLWFPGGRYQGEGYWFYHYVYAAETERGLEDREDLFNPGVIVTTLHPGETALVAASTTPLPPFETALEELLAGERARRAQVAGDGPVAHQWLRLAADAQVVDGRTAPRILAGYPWLEHWRRDELLALPGLLLSTGRSTVAAAIVRRTLADLASEQPAATRETLGVDTPLWLAFVLREWLANGADPAVAAELRAGLALLVARYRSGAVAGVAVDADGLLSAARQGEPLTWMDAWLGDWVVTPRQGKPVEVNALWHLALELLDDPSVALVRRRFVARFWDPARGWLADVVDGPDGDDARLRPNQLLAVSLSPHLLPDDVAGRIYQVLAARLRTPYGLRTLDPADPDYREQYTGGLAERDAAFHQGTVWPWLLGAWADAQQRCDPSAALGDLLQPFEAHLREYGLGQVAQVFDAVAPHRPRGCPSSAAATGELLRIVALTAG